MPDENRNWSILICAAFGLVGLSALIYFLCRRTATLETEVHLLRDQRITFLESLLPIASQGAQPIPLSLRMPTARRSLVPTTYNLVTDQAIRVATAFPERETIVTLSAVSPPGQYAILAADLATMVQADPASPAGGVYVLGVSDQPLVFQLAPGASLFARGSVDGLLLSVSLSETN